MKTVHFFWHPVIIARESFGMDRGHDSMSIIVVAMVLMTIIFLTKLLRR
jgi:hypothetical protein